MLVITISGCINTAVLTGNRPEDVVKSIAEVQEFLGDYPGSELFINYRSEGYIRGMISDISDRCGPYFKIADYWLVVFKDPASRSNITVWLEKDTNQLACLYGAGVDSPPVYIPGPEKAQLTITGFSGLDINPTTTEFYNKDLYFTVTNPNFERIILKKVTASYLDDVIENFTNTGFMSMGDSITYEFNFSNTIEDDELFWIDVDILYDSPDKSLSNQRSRGSVISGLDTTRIIQCSSASFVIERYNFYVGTRVFSVLIRNTGTIDLRIKTFFRQDDVLQEIGEPFTLWYKGTETIELAGLTRLAESVVFVSEACPGANQVIFVKDIAGV
jgi:hypothetical protein